MVLQSLNTHTMLNSRITEHGVSEPESFFEYLQQHDKIVEKVTRLKIILLKENIKFNICLNSSGSVDRI